MNANLRGRDEASLGNAQQKVRVGPCRGCAHEKGTRDPGSGALFQNSRERRGQEAPGSGAIGTASDE